MMFWIVNNYINSCFAFVSVVQTIPSNQQEVQCNGDIGHQSDEDSLSDYENNKENEDDDDEDDEDYNSKCGFDQMR